MDLSQLLTLIALHKWLLVVAVVVGFLVRQVKPDAALPIDVPARFRPLVAVLLGLVAAGCDSLLAGTPWKEALVTGVGGALLAILGHVFGIEVLRGGKELPPLGTKNGDPGDPPQPPALLTLSWLPVVAVASIAIASSCKPLPTLSPSSQTEIKQHATRVGACTALGAAAGKAGGLDAGLAAYDACLDGGAK